MKKEVKKPDKSPSKEPPSKAKSVMTQSEDLWGHQGLMEDYDGEFPFKMLFYDPKDDQVKEMTVTEEAWNDTIKTFEDNDKVSRNVIYKYMSKHETVETQSYFKE